MPEKKVTKEELLKKAKEPARKAMKWHPFYRGKIEIAPKVQVKSFDDFGVWYTPGVAEPCRDIHQNPDKVYEHTNKWNNVAVVSDGSRVLGLGDIGPMAGMPVMEGKGLLFKYLGGVDAFPICLDAHEPEDIVQATKWIAPSFGGINLEDISKPKCFYVLERLREELDIPVWHDDQQGTAAITLAGIINGLKVAGKKLEDVDIGLVGSGAANLCLARTLLKAGVPEKHLWLADSTGLLHPGRDDLSPEKDPEKYKFAQKTNLDQQEGGLPELIAGKDVVVAASKPGPDTIKKEWLRHMNDDAILFAEANPIPEIWPWEAKEAGVRIVGTGRSDFPNQVNNSIGFPGIFRGALDVRAKTISDEMHIEAAFAIAEVAEEAGLDEEHLVPTMENTEVYIRQAVRVALKAIEQNLARVKLSEQELREKAEAIIMSSREKTQHMMEAGYIEDAPPL
ncbi:MAG: NADP-dependent malic enzyme [Candidatus Thermoplasmatota archaeon]|nr:NADP-dependent malic enzyme [Candidatus Thermoplasmatota archaeon]